MIKIDIDGPYRPKNKSMLSRFSNCLAYALIFLIALCIAWIVLIWMLDIYLSIGLQELPIIKPQSLTTRV